MEAAAPAPVGGAVSPASVTERVTPTSIRIPSIGVRAPLDPLGFDGAERTVEVPENPDHAGWYRHGSTPGAGGAAVILGHVDSLTGPAVFTRLRELRAGDAITVTMSDRSRLRYAVTKVATYVNAKFPARRVYRATGPSTLSLVTCGGVYDRAVGAYRSNVVVYAELAPPRAG